MSIRSVTSVALLCLSLSVPVHATILGYAQYDVANITSTFDPTSGILEWSGQGSTSATFSLLAKFDRGGSLLGGFFTMADDTTVYYLGLVDSYDLLVRDDYLHTCPDDDPIPTRCPPGTQQGVLIETVGLRDVYVSPLLPTWGTRTYATTYDWTSFGNPPFQGSVLSRDELFRLGWSADNIIQSHLFSEVPEPGALLTMLWGLVALGLSQLRAARPSVFLGLH